MKTELGRIAKLSHLMEDLLENLALMDSDFFSELQSSLQALARLEGVDVSDHAQWDAWLDQRHVPPWPSRRQRERRFDHPARAPRGDNHLLDQLNLFSLSVGLLAVDCRALDRERVARALVAAVSTGPATTAAEPA